MGAEKYDKYITGKLHKFTKFLFFFVKRMHHFKLITCVCCLLIWNLSCRKKCCQRWRSCGLGCFYRELGPAGVAFIQLCRTSKFLSISDVWSSHGSKTRVALYLAFINKHVHNKFFKTIYIVITVFKNLTFDPLYLDFGFGIISPSHFNKEFSSDFYEKVYISARTEWPRLMEPVHSIYISHTGAPQLEVVLLLGINTTSLLSF